MTHNNLHIKEARLIIMCVRKIACLSITKAVQALNDEYTIPVISNDAVRTEKRRGVLVAAFTRNPFDRFVSFFAHLVNGKLYRALKPLGFTDGMTFEDTARLVASIPDQAADPHFASQMHALSVDGEFLPHWCGWFEELDGSWRDLREMTGNILPEKLPHKNASTRRPWREYYDDETLGLIRERYADDFECLSYAPSRPGVPRRQRSRPHTSEADVPGP